MQHNHGPARAGYLTLGPFQPQSPEGARRRRLWNISAPAVYHHTAVGAAIAHARLSGQAVAKPYQADIESTCSAAVRPGRSASTRHASLPSALWCAAPRFHWLLSRFLAVLTPFKARLRGEE